MRSSESSVLPDPREVFAISADELNSTARRAELESIVTALLAAREDAFEEWAITSLELFAAKDAGELNVRMVRTDAADAIARDGLSLVGDEELVDLARNQFALRDVRDAIGRLKDCYDNWCGESAADASIPREEKSTQPEPKNPPNPGGWWVFVQYAAAAVLLLSLSIACVTSVRAAANARREKDIVTAQFIQMNKAKPLPPTAKEAYQMGLANAVRVDVRPAPLQGRPGLIHLLLSNFAQPPYIVRISLDWNDPPANSTQKTMFEDIYVAGQQALTPIVSHDYTHRLPSSGEDQITITVLFELTGESMRQMGIGPVLKQVIHLRLTPDGIRVASPGEADATTVAIQAPAEGATVADPFMLEFRVARPVRITERPAGRLHILVRPLNGQESLRDRYFVVPFQDDDIGGAGGGVREGKLWIPLRALMDLDAVRPATERPTQFEITFVDLPFVLTDWSFPAHELDLSSPSLAGAVKNRLTINANITHE